MNEVNPFKPIHFRQRGKRKVVIPADEETFERYASDPTVNRPLINAIARAFYWARLIDSGIVKNGSDIAQREKLDASTVNECLRLALLAPHIVESVLSGTQPTKLTMQWLTRNPLPKNWDDQKNTLNSKGSHLHIPTRQSHRQADSGTHTQCSL